MTQRTWLILGATSIIAEEFARQVAQSGHQLRLVGRDPAQLELIANDLKLRYAVHCDYLIMDMNDLSQRTESLFASIDGELDLFIAHSDFTGNEHLNQQTITQLIQVNILATTLIINAYLNREQSEHNLLFLSSVAACRGRAKNSLYGASKAAIEVYLEGLQQAAPSSQHISIVRLGFIDTKQTYGLPGIFYAAPPKSCAAACLKALQKKKRVIYYPNFWWAIMAIMKRVPFFIYKRMGEV